MSKSRALPVIQVPGFDVGLSNGTAGDVILTPADSKPGRKRADHSQQFKRIGSRKALAGRGDITLSQPGKMPCYGWSLPAGKACPASKGTIERHGANAVCKFCYAKGGNYIYPNVKASLELRFQFVLDSLRKDNGETFVRTMVDMIGRAVEVTGPYFRIHDSGDFFHPMYVQCWQRICEALPHVHFWAPTREHLRPMMLPFLRSLASLPNVTIRPSAEAIGQDAPMVDGLSAGSAVATGDLPGHNTCPATLGVPKCEEHGCRKCWTNKSEPVTYRLH